MQSQCLCDSGWIYICMYTKCDHQLKIRALFNPYLMHARQDDFQPLSHIVYIWGVSVWLWLWGASLIRMHVNIIESQKVVTHTNRATHTFHAQQTNTIIADKRCTFREWSWGLEMEAIASHTYFYTHVLLAYTEWCLLSLSLSQNRCDIVTFKGDSVTVRLVCFRAIVKYAKT